jgi:hypothetical protein
MKHTLFAVIFALSLRGADPISLVSATPVKICAECGQKISVRLLVAAGKTNAKTAVDIADIDVDGTHNAELLKAFSKPEWDVIRDEIVAVKLDVSDPVALKKQGTYTILLRVQPPGAQAFFLKPQLAHPPASIDSPGTITVDRVFELGWAPKYPQVQVAPKTQDAGLTDVVVRKLKPAAGPNGSTIGGSLDFGVVQAAPVGQHADIPLSLKDNFPFGKSTGQAEITAPQLAAPVPFNYEIVTRLSPFWIFPAALIGVFLGLVTRVFLQGRIEFRKAQIAADGLLSRVETDLHDKHDADFQRALAQPVADLGDALKNSETAGITTATRDLDTAWRAELKNLADRVRTQSVEVELLASMVQTQWPKLPRRLQGVLNAVPIDGLRRLIRDSNAAEARIEVAARWQNLEIALEDQRREWKHDFQNQLNLLSGADASGISVANRQTYTNRVATLVANWKGFKIPAKEEVVTFLRDAHSDAEDADDLLHEFTKAIRTEWAANKRRIPEGSRPPFAALEEASFAFCERLETGFRDPAAFPKQADLDALRDAWLAPLLQSAPQQQQRVRDLIAGGAFSDAVNAAFNLMAPEMDFGPPGGPQFRERRPVPVATMDIHVVVGEGESPEPLGMQIARARTQLARDQGWLSLGVAIVYSIIALVTFGPKYVGDVFEWGTIILWGFGLDFALDAVVRSIPKKS